MEKEEVPKEERLVTSHEIANLLRRGNATLCWRAERIEGLENHPMREVIDDIVRQFRETDRITTKQAKVLCRALIIAEKQAKMK